jgi:hypothetical protein
LLSKRPNVNIPVPKEGPESHRELHHSHAVVRRSLYT